MNRSALLPALLPALLLPACGGDESAITPPSPAPLTTPPVSAAPSQSAPRPSTVSDGRDLAACRDGDCEVILKEGDVLRFGTGLETDPLTVVRAGETLTITDPSGFTASVGGAGGKLQTGAVQIQVGESAGKRTAVRISPRP
ncbi:hypothetical protein E1200_06050 [Actinomadura sp. GC306]|uniref:hypothetical protein n=1 Tax=Actinomadura sp. GC306 TaxID=2530367 RepID=UPI00105252F3|nr:hypothetical protein [Actinomadura sp. GC306]TDC70151.1 hypothetical protein E1200_06050 [Actinomadura sp. GC306]